MSGSSAYLALETVSLVSAIKWGMPIDLPRFTWKLTKDLWKNLTSIRSYCLLSASCRCSLSSIPKCSLCKVQIWPLFL